MRLKTTRPLAALRQGKIDWYRITKNQAEDTADVYIYDEIGYFGTSAQDFVRELSQTEASTLNIHINSPGGDAFDGIAIYNAIKKRKGTCNTFVDGLAASAASFIAMAGDTVTIARNAEMMIHDAWGMVIGNAEDMRKAVDMLDKLSNNIADIYAQKTGGSVEFWRSKMQEETWYTGVEALTAGLADKIGDSSTEDVTNGWDLSIFNYAGRAYAPSPSKDEFKLDDNALRNVLKEMFR